MQNVTWQDLIQLGIMLGTWANLFYMIYCDKNNRLLFPNATVIF